MSPLGVWGKSVLGSGNSKSKGPQIGVCLKGSLGSLEEGITVIGISWISLAAGESRLRGGQVRSIVYKGMAGIQREKRWRWRHSEILNRILRVVKRVSEELTYGVMGEWEQSGICQHWLALQLGEWNCLNLRWGTMWGVGLGQEFQILIWGILRLCWLLSPPSGDVEKG